MNSELRLQDTRGDDHANPWTDAVRAIPPGSSGWINITPTMAQAALSLSTCNYRKLSVDVARKYSGHMDRGEWVPSPQPIIIRPDLSVADGQHRMNAIVLHGRAVRMLVYRAAANELDESVLDIGKRRTDVDVLSRYGVDRPKRVAAAIKCWAKLFIDNNPKDLRNNNTRFSHREVHGLVMEHLGIGFCADRVYSSKGRPVGMKANITAAVFYEISRHDHDLAEMWLDQVVDGCGITADSTVYQLRSSMQSRGNKVSREPDTQAALLIKAVAWVRTGATIRPVWNNAKGEPFPRLDVEMR